MADLKISELPQLSSGQLTAGDPLPVVDVSASTTKKVTALDLVRDGINLLPAGAIPGDKVALVIPDGSITTPKIADGAVTAAKLAANSVTVVGATLPAAGAYVGQLAFNTSTTPNTSYVWTGSAWALSSGVTNAAGVTTGLVNTYVSTTGGNVTITADLDATSAASQFLAGPTGSGGTITARGIVSQDLPIASTTKGAVAVNGNGLVMAGDVIRIANSVSANASSGHLVTYDANGLVTGGAKITPPDLPLATNSTVGAIRPDTDLSVSVTGTLTHTNSIAAGTAAKVTYDANGHITAALSLLEADIPSLGASKITSGAFGGNRIEQSAITSEKLANYSVCVIQEAEPGPGDYVGQFWYRESDAQLRTWSNNSWIPVGFGRLSQENLRFCGTFDASTGTVLNVTTFGSTAGMTAGSPIPTATEPLTGAYLVAITPGAYNGETYDNGDWTLCLGTAIGWQRVDTLSSAGGGGTIKLDDLLDVTITTPQSGDSLIFDATTNTWKNRTTHGVKISLIEPFDGTRSTFTTGRAIVSENNLVVSLGGVIQNPGVDFTAVAGSSQISFATAPPSGISYWILQEAAVEGGGGGGTALPTGTADEEYLKWNNTLGAWEPSNTLDGGSY